MDDKNEHSSQTTHILLDGAEIGEVLQPLARPSIIGNLTNAELDWLADEIGKRLQARWASEIRASGRPIGGVW